MFQRGTPRENHPISGPKIWHQHCFMAGMALCVHSRSADRFGRVSGELAEDLQALQRRREVIMCPRFATRTSLTIAAAFLAFCQLIPVTPSEAAYLEDVPQVLIQPDGTRIECFASGDEHYHWLHDADGFVIVRDPDSGYWVWAEKSQGVIAATQHVVGRIPPNLLGLEPRILPDRNNLKSERLDRFSSPPVQPAP